MTIVTAHAPFPPTGTQLVSGPGTVVSVSVARPKGSQGGNSAIDASFYDSPANTPGTPGNPGTLIGSVRTARGFNSADPANDYQAAVLNASFTNGLYVVLRSPSSINVTYEVADEQQE